MVADAYNIYGKDVCEGGTPDKPWQDQSIGVKPGVNLGITMDSGIHEESNGRRGQIRKNWGKLRGEYSLFNHIERTYGIVLPQNRGVDVGRARPETYRVYFLQVLKLASFLVDGCPTRKNNPGRLQKNFMY